MSRVKNWLLYIVLVLSLFISCDMGHVAFEQNVPIANGNWSKDHTISITIPVQDTLQYYNLQLYLRNNNNYAYSNIYMFVNVIAPTGAKVVDTVHYLMANDNGEWLGKGGTQLWDNRFPFRSNIKFATKGNYQFEIRHGMRDDELEGITDVGLRMVELDNQ